MDGLRNTPIERYMLPDTLGVLNPMQVSLYVSQMVARYPDVHFDFHAHNDYDLAVANVLAAAQVGCKGLHTAVNGLGERAGNAPLASVQAVLADQATLDTHINEEQLGLLVSYLWYPFVFAYKSSISPTKIKIFATAS